MVKNSLRAQLFSLQGLLAYLEDRGTLEAKDYLYCQSKLADTVKHLKRLEKLTSGERR